jgi:hypothetical protein
MPPAAGEYIGWDWDAFYLAILSVLRNPRSGAAYAEAMNDVNNLPSAMQFTEPVLAAAWARFAVIFPSWDLKAAYALMESFLKQTGRLREGDMRQWYVIEQGWQALETAEERRTQYIEYAGIPANPLGRLPVYDVSSGSAMYIPLRPVGIRATTGRYRKPVPGQYKPPPENIIQRSRATIRGFNRNF